MLNDLRAGDIKSEALPALMLPAELNNHESRPSVVRFGYDGMWGVQGRTLYKSNSNGRVWEKENVFEFEIADFDLLWLVRGRDSILVFWTASGDNYRYTICTRKIAPYYPEKTLSDFVKSPIKKMTIRSSSHGCFHSDEHIIKYTKSRGKKLSASKYSKHEEEDSVLAFRHELDIQTLALILDSIDQNISFFPSLKSFGITEQDKKNYLDMLKSQVSKEARSFYEQVPDALDTISNGFLKSILARGWEYNSTTRTNFTIYLVNSNNDTLLVRRRSDGDNSPWHLPWTFEFDGKHFTCYNLDFSKQIKSCLPNDFMSAYSFDNAELIMKIADFLYLIRGD